MSNQPTPRYLCPTPVPLELFETVVRLLKRTHLLSGIRAFRGSQMFAHLHAHKYIYMAWIHQHVHTKKMSFCNDPFLEHVQALVRTSPEKRQNQNLLRHTSRHDYSTASKTDRWLVEVRTPMHLTAPCIWGSCCKNVGKMPILSHASQR